jgi:hypothetical protein
LANEGLSWSSQHKKGPFKPSGRRHSGSARRLGNEATAGEGNVKLASFRALGPNGGEGFTRKSGRPTVSPLGQGIRCAQRFGNCVGRQQLVTFVPVDDVEDRGRVV